MRKFRRAVNLEIPFHSGHLNSFVASAISLDHISLPTLPVSLIRVVVIQRDDLNNNINSRSVVVVFSTTPASLINHSPYAEPKFALELETSFFTVVYSKAT